MLKTCVATRLKYPFSVLKKIKCFFTDLIWNLLLWFPLNLKKKLQNIFLFHFIVRFFFGRSLVLRALRTNFKTQYLFKICFSIIFWLLWKICSHFFGLNSGHAVIKLHKVYRSESKQSVYLLNYLFSMISWCVYIIRKNSC